MKASTSLLVLFLLGTGGPEGDSRESSPHFRDGVFHNTNQDDTWDIDTIEKGSKKNWARWPKWVDIEEEEEPAERVHGPQVRVTFVNHSTFLIQTNGYNILTDPIYSKRSSPFSFIGPKRVHRPSIPFEKMPKIDVILISHDHYDHLDLPTLSQIVERDQSRIYVGLGVARHLEEEYDVTEMDWWESVQVSKEFRLTFVEVQHNSGKKHIRSSQHPVGRICDGDRRQKNLFRR